MLDLKNKTKPVAQGHKIVAAGSYGALSHMPRFLWRDLLSQYPGPRCYDGPAPAPVLTGPKPYGRAI